MWEENPNCTEKLYLDEAGWLKFKFSWLLWVKAGSLTMFKWTGIHGINSFLYVFNKHGKPVIVGNKLWLNDKEERLQKTNSLAALLKTMLFTIPSRGKIAQSQTQALQSFLKDHLQVIHSAALKQHVCSTDQPCLNSWQAQPVSISKPPPSSCGWAFSSNNAGYNHGNSQTVAFLTDSKAIALLFPHDFFYFHSLQEQQ